MQQRSQEKISLLQSQLATEQDRVQELIRKEEELKHSLNEASGASQKTINELNNEIEKMAEESLAMY